MVAELKRPLAAAGERRTESGGVWFASYGSIGNLYGDVSTHSMGYALHGFAGGGDLQLAEGLLVGVALSYSSTGFSTSVVNSAGSNEAMSVAAYASYAPDAWYVDAAAGYSYNWGTLSRTIAFPGVLRTSAVKHDGQSVPGQRRSGPGGAAQSSPGRNAVRPPGRHDGHPERLQ